MMPAVVWHILHLLHLDYQFNVPLDLSYLGKQIQ